MPRLKVVAREREDRFHADPERSFTMASHYYTSSEVHEREKEAIFYRAWNLVGHVGQLPDIGSYFACRVHDQNLFAVRGKDGELRAFYNVCQHRGHELLKGEGCTKVITCPYHAWSYHIDGRLRTARGSENVAGFDKSEFCLTQVRIEEFCGFLFVNLDPEAPPLADQVPGLADKMRDYEPDLDRLVFSHRLTYEIKANWKNVIDNYLECYHCPGAHRAFSDLVDITQYRSVTYGIHSSHIGAAGPSNNTAFTFEPGSNQQNHFAGWWLWPNLAFNTLPGAANMSTFHIIPTGPETTLEHLDFYFLDSTPNAEQRDAIEYVDKVLQPEDIGLVESVQRGLNSRGYDQGRFMVDKDRSDVSEHAVHHFQSLVQDALGN